MLCNECRWRGILFLEGQIGKHWKTVEKFARSTPITQCKRSESKPKNPWKNQNLTRFCQLCRTEGHTVMYCPGKQIQSNFQNQKFYRPRQNNFGEYSNRNFRPLHRNRNQFPFRQFGPQRNSFQTQNRFPQNRIGSQNNFQNQQRNFIQNLYRQNYPGSNQNYSNQHNPQHPPFQISNNEANQNQPPNVQYVNQQDVTKKGIWSDNIRLQMFYKYNLIMPWSIKLSVLVALPF